MRARGLERDVIRLQVRTVRAVLYCIVLYCTILYCIVLYYIVLYCIVLSCIELRFIVLFYFVNLVHRILQYSSYLSNNNILV